MQLLRGLHNPGIDEAGCVATIGNFDGVHLGHQAVIQRVIDKASALDLPALAIVFEPQPLEFFRKTDAPARLMSFREKYSALQTFALDYVFCLKFDEALSGLSAQSFVEKVLLRHLHIRHLVVGDDFRFGDEREGDFLLLEQLGRQHGYTVENTPTCSDGHKLTDNRISSTRIRECLYAGQLQEAERLLGRPYRISGRVMHGEKLGRQLGFPTANVRLNRNRVPMSGVFAVRVRRENGRVVDGVANLGVKPTVGNYLPTLEVHLLDFGENIYGEFLTVEFCHKLREEQRFDGLDALKKQIETDIQTAMTLLARHEPYSKI